MSRRERTGQYTPLEMIKRKGDVYDADRRFKIKLGYHAMAWPQLAAIIPPALMTGLKTDQGTFPIAETMTALTTTYPVFGAGGAVIGGAAYGYMRNKDNKRREKAETRQQAIRDELNEPVDIIRTNKGHRNNRELHMRWYGSDWEWGDDDWVDDSEKIASRAERMKNIANYAEDTGIKSVTIGADWVEYLDIDLKQYSAITLHEDTDYHKYLRIQTHDEHADEQLLTTSPETLRQIADDLLSESTHEFERKSLLEKIVNELRDPKLLAMYRLHETHGTGQAKAMLQERLRQMIENDSTKEGSFIIASRNEYGAPVRRRATGFTHVTAKNISSSHSWQDDMGNEGYGHDGTASLLATVQVKDIEELLDLANDKKPVTPLQKKRHIMAAYFLSQDESLMRYIDDEATTQKATLKNRDETDGHTTTFQAMNEDRLRTIPRLSPTKSSTADTRINYHYSFPAVKRRIGVAAASLSLAFGTGMSMLTAADILEDTLKQTTREASQTVIDELGEEKFLTKEYTEALSQQRDKELGWLKHLDNASTYLQIADNKISEMMAEAYSKVLGNSAADYLTDGFASMSWKMNLPKLPDESSSPELSNSIGDVENDGLDRVLAEIESPTGKPTDGYWFNELQNYASLAYEGEAPLNINLRFWSDVQSGIIRKDTQLPVGTSRVKNLLWKDGDIARAAPDFIVKMPYYSTNYDLLPLPIAQNGQIIGAAYYDKDHPERRIPIKSLLVEDASGAYKIDTADEKTINELTSRNIDNPMIEYSIKERTNAGVRHNSATTIDGIDQINVAREVRQALGLSVDATNQEVYDVIKSRSYSLTPIKDQNLPKGTLVAPEDIALKYPALAADDLGEFLATLDALNCNLASALTILATNSGGEDEYQQAHGFHENGDGKITAGEAHAWLVDKDNNVVDPTPYGQPETTEPDPDGLKSESINRHYDRWGGVLVGAATLIIAYRKRELLAKKARSQVTYFDGTRTRHVANHEATPEAISSIQSALYGSASRHTQHVTLPANKILDALKNDLPNPLPSVREVKQLLDEKNIPTSDAALRGISRIIRHQKAIQRSKTR